MQINRFARKYRSLKGWQDYPGSLGIEKEADEIQIIFLGCNH